MSKYAALPLARLHWPKSGYPPLPLEDSLSMSRVLDPLRKRKLWAMNVSNELGTFEKCQEAILRKALYLSCENFLCWRPWGCVVGKVGSSHAGLNLVFGHPCCPAWIKPPFQRHAVFSCILWEWQQLSKFSFRATSLLTDNGRIPLRWIWVDSCVGLKQQTMFESSGTFKTNKA